MAQTKTANKKSTVLALYLNARAVGYAAMDIPAEIKSSNYRYLTPNDPEAYLEYIAYMIRRFDPKVVLIEPESSRNQSRGKRMRDLFYKIETLIDELEYPIQYYSRRMISDTFNGLNKMEIVDEIIQQFPSYAYKRPPNRANYDGGESPAWSEFDAISMVMTHFLYRD
ncbi:MAG: hypothetical protein Crog4KO_18860 [Crocinitomicaceae bacterium]